MQYNIVLLYYMSASLIICTSYFPALHHVFKVLIRRQPISPPPRLCNPLKARIHISNFLTLSLKYNLCTGEATEGRGRCQSKRGLASQRPRAVQGPHFQKCASPVCRLFLSVRLGQRSVAGCASTSRAHKLLSGSPPLATVCTFV